MTALLPMEPLLEHLAAHDDAHAARMLGLHPDTVSAWRRGTRLPSIHPYRADKYACALGVHPTAIWGDHWWNAA